MVTREMPGRSAARHSARRARIVLTSGISRADAATAGGTLHVGAWVAVPVARGAAARQALGRFAFTKIPVFGRLDERRVEDGGGDFETAAGLLCAAHAVVRYQ